MNKRLLQANSFDVPLQVLRSDILSDTGASLNPEVDIGQIEGGFVFGLGLWLQELLVYDAKTGKLLTNDTWYNLRNLCA